MNEGKSENTGASARQGIVLLAASVMPIMAIVSLVPVLPMLMGEFSSAEGSEFLVPMALTIPALCVAVFSPVAGWLADQVGRKNLLLAALLLYAAFGILPWFLADLFQIIGARIALGLVEAVIMTVATVLIGDYFDGEQRKKWIGLQVAVGSIAAIVLIAISGALGDAFGSRGPFLLYLLAIPIAFAAAVLLYEPKVVAIAKSAAEKFPYSVMLPLALTTLGVGIVFYTVNVQLGSILEMSGPVSPGTIGLIGAAGNLAMVTGTLIFNRFKQYVGPRLLTVGLLLAAFGYAGAALSATLPTIAAFALLAFLGSGMMLPNMLTWAMQSLPPAVRGRGMGLWTGAFFLGQFLAPIALAAVTGVTGTLAAALLAYAVIITLGAVGALVLSRSGRGVVEA